MKALKFARWLLVGPLLCFAFGVLATPLTDDIRTLNATHKVAIDAKLAEIDALPPSGAPGPLVWPAPIDLLGGTAPALISYPEGHPGDSGGFPEPSKSRRKIGADVDGMGYIFGDSLTQGMPPVFVSPFAENFSIGGRTLRMIINELHEFPGLRHGSFGVLGGAANDLSMTWYYGSHGAAVSTVLYMHSNILKPWLRGTWKILEILPQVATNPNAASYNAAVWAVNDGLAAAYAGAAANIEIVRVNPLILEPDRSLKPAAAHSDGQHPSGWGHKMQGKMIYESLQRSGINPP